MKKHILYFCLLLGFMVFKETVYAQSFGLGVNTGLYNPTYTNSSGVSEKVSGKGILGISIISELSLIESENSKFPVGIHYHRFSTEHQLNEVQTMTNAAQSLQIDLGYKYYFARQEKHIRPFTQLGMAYETLIQSTYFLNEFQQGDLNWKSNLYANIQAGLSFKSSNSSRVDIYGKVGLGLFNRLSENGKYTDQIFTLGSNIIFN